MYSMKLGLFSMWITLTVRYHCGGWSEEVNSCILISYMVYLQPKQSLGYQQHSYPAIIIMHIYNWYHSNVIGIHYVHESGYNIHGAFPLLFYLPLLIPFCSPFYLLGNLPSCDRILPPRTQVARKLTSHFPPLSHIPLVPKSRPPGVPRSKYTFIRTTSRTWLTRSSTLTGV
jgi:hypothetical protein